MPGPSVSVLMPTYKHQAYIAQAIESVLAQRFGDFELVITDDHSPDQTYAVAEAYARKDPRVRVFRNPQNLGLSANYTRCFQNAYPQSGYFIILPSDDWWMPETLEVLVATAEQNPRATFVHADGYKVKDHGVVPYLSIFRHLPPRGCTAGCASCTRTTTSWCKPPWYGEASSSASTAAPSSSIRITSSSPITNCGWNF